MRKLFSGVGLALFWVLPLLAFNPTGTLSERKRSIIKSFSVSQRDRLFVSNQHGETKVNVWDKNEVRAEIVIMGYGKDDDEAQRFIEAIGIDEARSGNQIRLETRYNEPRNESWNWRSWGRSGESDGKTRGVKISYTVYMPRYMPLELQSRFANATLTDFSAPLRANTQYGDFVADRLMNTDNDIRVDYGKAIIHQLNEGNLRIQYSKLELDKAERLRLVNNYGTLTLEEVADLDATIQYSKGKIGKLKEQGKLNINYSENLQLPVLANSVKNLDVRCNYTTVRLPVRENQDLDFDVTVTFANFGYPNALPISFEVKDDGTDDTRQRYVPKSTKVYKGRVGRGGSTVRIVSNYGGVKFVN